MFILLDGERRNVWSLHALAVDFLRKSQSLEQVVMDFHFLGAVDEYGVCSQMGCFLLSRGSNEMRRLCWDGEHKNRFLLPLRHEDIVRWVQ